MPAAATRSAGQLGFTGRRLQRATRRVSGTHPTIWDWKNMIKITCDNCGSVRPEVVPSNEEWVLGYDVEIEARNAVQRSIRFLDHWDSRRVMEVGAIHLCSLECRDEYVAKSRAA